MLVSKEEKENYLEENYLEIVIDGSIDTISAPKLEKFLSSVVLDGAKDIVINLEKVSYVSSAGLRTFLTVLRLLEHVKASSLILLKPSPSVKRVFDITGFTPLFDIRDNI